MVALGVLFVALSSVAPAQAPAAMPKPNAEMKKLDMLIGTWMYTGDAIKSVFGPAGKVTGSDVYEMLPGGFFMQHHWDEQNPLGNAKGVEIWGYDAVKKNFTFNYFNSFGDWGSGTLTINGTAYASTSSGVSYDGKTNKGRCTGTLTAKTWTIKCDASADGNTWAHSFDGTWTKK
jgi:hypothetical protein